MASPLVDILTSIHSINSSNNLNHSNANVKTSWRKSIKSGLNDSLIRIDAFWIAGMVVCIANHSKASIAGITWSFCVMSSPALAARHAVPASEVVTALRRIENGSGMPGAGIAAAFAHASTGPAYHGRPATDTNERLLDRARELSLDSVIRDIADLRVSIRHAFVAASPEYQLLIELSENGLRDCAKCVRELEARAAQHPYNKMLTKIDAAYDTAVRATRSGS